VRHPHPPIPIVPWRVVDGVVQLLRRECTDRLLVYNRRHLAHVLDKYVRQYNSHRPHRSLNQQSPIPTSVAATPTGTSVLRRRRVLGGLINEYSYQQAA
jgi:putative transposase